MTSCIFRKRSTEAGFTLVEIAIVLVIIGLLLGGILKGQEMITQAKIKNIINDFNGVTVAVTSYQDRYRAIPGDDQNATTRWTTQAPGKGNGDGVILGFYNANDTTGTGGAPADLKESNLFWPSTERSRRPHRRRVRSGRHKRPGLHQHDHMLLEFT